jgi:hypothetical protein
MGDETLAVNQDGINIGTISGGIVNFGGAVYISPISITKTVTGSGEANQETMNSDSDGINAIFDVIKTMRRSR